MAQRQAVLTLELTGRDEPPNPSKFSMKDKLTRAPVE
jgi:hypothetical protein